MRMQRSKHLLPSLRALSTHAPLPCLQRSSFLESHRDLLQPTDFVLSADGRQVANNHGGIALGMRCVFAWGRLVHCALRTCIAGQGCLAPVASD